MIFRKSPEFLGDELGRFAPDSGIDLVENERTFTKMKKLDFEDRVEEIARLMSGTRITKLTLENARDMLQHNLRES